MEVRPHVGGVRRVGARLALGLRLPVENVRLRAGAEQVGLEALRYGVADDGIGAIRIYLGK
jgi:hypothetical protein